MVEVERTPVTRTTVLTRLVNIAVAYVAPEMERSVIDALAVRVKFPLLNMSLVLYHRICRVGVGCPKRQNSHDYKEDEVH